MIICFSATARLQREKHSAPGARFRPAASAGFHPADGLIEAVACRGGAAEPMVAHGQEEQIECIGIARTALEARFERDDGFLGLAVAVEGDAERVVVHVLVRRERDRLAGEQHGLGGVAQLGRANDQQPGELIARRRGLRVQAQGAAQRRDCPVRLLPRLRDRFANQALSLDLARRRGGCSYLDDARVGGRPAHIQADPSPVPLT